MIDSVKRFKPTKGNRIAALILVGLCSTVVAFLATDAFLTVLTTFLTVLGLLLTPWTAINLVDFYVVRRGHYSIREMFNPRGMYGRWSWPGLASYLIGFVAMLPFFVVSDFVGPVAEQLNGVDISMIVGLIVSSGIYLVTSRSFDLTAEQELIAEADRGIEVDGSNAHHDAGALLLAPDHDHDV